MDAITKSLMTSDGHFPRGAFVFYHADYPADVVIRLGSGAYFSHVAIANGDGSAICAWAGGGGLRSGVIPGYVDVGAPGGVVEARMVKWLKPFEIENLMKFLDQQIGKPYDYLGWLGSPLQRLGLRMNGGVPDSYHCASLAAAAINDTCGILMGVHRSLRSYSPQDVWEFFQ